MIDPNKLKKGTRGVLKDGGNFILIDNRRGNIRMAQVDGLFGTSMGSIYLKDIAYVEVGGDAVKLDLSRYKTQNDIIKTLGF